MVGKHMSAVAVALAVFVAVPLTSGAADAAKTGGVPAELVGVWSRSVTKANWKKYGITPGLPGESGGYPVGVWTIVVKKSGSISAYSPNGYIANCATCLADFKQRFSSAGAVLTFAPEPCSAKGLYRWKVAGSALTLGLVADKCGERKALFIGLWKRA